MRRLVLLALGMLLLSGPVWSQIVLPQITGVYAQCGGAPLYVLNVRVSIFNDGETGPVRATVAWRADASQPWQVLREWEGVRVTEGERRSLDFLGPSEGFPYAFQVQALVWGSSSRPVERITNAVRTQPNPAAPPPEAPEP